MDVNKKDILMAVNQVMARMFFLLPDLDELGRQRIGGPAPRRGAIIHLAVRNELILQLVFEEDLMRMMTSNIAALPLDELPRDWIRQIPLEASEVIWGRFITLNNENNDNDLSMIRPCETDHRADITGARWHFNFQSEDRRLGVSLIDQAHL